MLVVISPAKTLKTDLPAFENSSSPVLLSKSKKLVSILKKYKPAQLSNLMGINPDFSGLSPSYR